LYDATIIEYRSQKAEDRARNHLELLLPWQPKICASLCCPLPSGACVGCHCEYQQNLGYSTVRQFDLGINAEFSSALVVFGGGLKEALRPKDPAEMSQLGLSCSFINIASKLMKEPSYANFFANPDKLRKLVALAKPEDIDPASAFISHAWMSSFDELVDSVSNHSKREEEKDCVFDHGSFFDAVFRRDGATRRSALLMPRRKFYWLDLFCKDQWKADPKSIQPQLNPDDLAAAIAQYSCDTKAEFHRNISSAGVTEMIANGLSSGVTPDTLTRVWSLYEAHVSLSSLSTLLKLLQNDDNFSESALHVNISFESAEATVEADKEMIFQEVRKMKGGFVGLNDIVSKSIIGEQKLILDNALAEEVTNVRRAWSARILLWISVVPIISVAGYVVREIRNGVSSFVLANLLLLLISGASYTKLATHAKNVSIASDKRRHEIEVCLKRLMNGRRREDIGPDVPLPGQSFSNTLNFT
jgi:hypothetical protein